MPKLPPLRKFTAKDIRARRSPRGYFKKSYDLGDLEITKVLSNREQKDYMRHYFYFLCPPTERSEGG